MMHHVFILYVMPGEVHVLEDKLRSLIKAAESLKIKGLAVQDEDSLEVTSSSYVFLCQAYLNSIHTGCEFFPTFLLGCLREIAVAPKPENNFLTFIRLNTI